MFKKLFLLAGVAISAAHAIAEETVPAFEALQKQELSAEAELLLSQAPAETAEIQEESAIKADMKAKLEKATSAEYSFYGPVNVTRRLKEKRSLLAECRHNNCDRLYIEALAELYAKNPMNEKDLAAFAASLVFVQEFKA